jgi:hypothetical protein
MVTAMFGGFEQAKDEKARKRWFASAGTSLIVYAVVGAGLVFLASQTVAKAKEEPPLEVTFAPTAAAPEPVKTEAPPPPPPPKNAPRAKRPGKPAPTTVAKIPDARPEESEPTGAIEPGSPRSTAMARTAPARSHRRRHRRRHRPHRRRRCRRRRPSTRPRRSWPPRRCPATPCPPIPTPPARPGARATSS